MTLNCYMMVERNPNLKGEVGGSICGHEISSLLDKNLPGDQLPHVLWRCQSAICLQKKFKKFEVENNLGKWESKD